MCYNKVMIKRQATTKKRSSTKAIIYYLCCALIGVLIGAWLFGKLSKPYWQTKEDQEIQLRKEAGTLDEYILTRFVLSLRHDGQSPYKGEYDEIYTYEDQYNYVAKATGYKCEKTSDYSDDKPYEEIAKCHKP